MRWRGLLVFFLCSISILAGEETQTGNTSYLLNLDLKGSGVDLRWEGYWKIGILSGGNLGGENARSSSYGLASGVSFFQNPDLVLSLWLNNKWFIETSILEKVERNTYRAGYVGQEDEFLRSFTVGNRDISADGYAGIDVPDPKRNTPGLAIQLGTDSSKHDFLIRYDPTKGRSRTFRGGYEVDSEEIELFNFVKGRYFILPDTKISNFQVYLEDKNGTVTGTSPNGTERRYRSIKPPEYFLENKNGLMELNQSYNGEVLIYYEMEGKPVGESSLGKKFLISSDASFRPNTVEDVLDFNFDVEDPYDPEQRKFRETSVVRIGETLFLRVYNPGSFTPFERQNVYAPSLFIPKETWKISTLLRERGALYPRMPASDFGFVTDYNKKTITVYAQETSNSQTNTLRLPVNRYPFSGSDPSIYGLSREINSEKISRKLVVAVRGNNQGYYIGTGVVPGSVVALINGVQDGGVQVSDGGILQLSRLIYPDDWVEVSYRVESIDLDGGDLYIYQGNRFQLAPNLTWELAESFRWNITQNKSVDLYNQSPGNIMVKTSMNWRPKNASLRFSGDLTVRTADTSGALRLYSMNNGGYMIGLFKSTLVRPPLGGNLRVRSEKYKYTSKDSLGNEILNDYKWSGALAGDDDGFALAAGRSGDPHPGVVMDMRFELNPSQWTSGDFLADPKGPIDLSDYTAVEIPVKFISDYGTSGIKGSSPRITLLMGEIGEKDDYHKDGIVNRLNKGLMLELDLEKDVDNNIAFGKISDVWKTPDTWAMLRLNLSPMQRARLRWVRSFRIRMENSGSSSISGRLITGAPRFVGSSFRTEIRNKKNNLSPRQAVSGDEISDNTLKKIYPETAKLFHPNGERNQAFRLRWGKDAGSHLLETNERWEAVSWFPNVPLEAYRTLVFYVKSNQNIGKPVTVKITDKDEKGIVVSWMATSNVSEWDRITVDILGQSAVSDKGASILSVSVDQSTGELSRVLLSGSGESGTLYMDEIHFRDPSYSVKGGAEIDGSWHYPKDVSTLGSIPILGNISVRGRSRVSGGGVLSGVKKENASASGNVEIKADVLGMGIQTDWQIGLGRGKIDWSGNHTIRIPARGQYFWFEDVYSRSVTDGAIRFFRKNQIQFSVKPGLINLYTEASDDGNNFIQSWGGSTEWIGKNWSSQADARYVMSMNGQSQKNGNYFTTWIQNYTKVVPSASDVKRREAHHTFSGNIKFGSFSMRWLPELRIKSWKHPLKKQENFWGSTLAFPLKFEQWTLVPSYRREMRQTFSINHISGGSFGTDWTGFSQNMLGDFPLITYMPFREIFFIQDAKRFRSNTRNLIEVDYHPQIKLALYRDTKSEIIDLFVPSSADVSIERLYKRKSTTVGWENIWRYSLDFIAENLFGFYGRYPLFPFYNNEILTTTVEFIQKDYNNSSLPSPQKLFWQFNWKFKGKQHNEFSLNNRLSWHWSSTLRETRQELSFDFLWRLSARQGLNLPFSKKTLPWQHYLQNKERLIIKGLYPWKQADVEEKFDLAFVIRHETSWIFQDVGYLKGWIAFGIGGRGKIMTNAWEAGLEAEVRF